jgi:hypothetical protein
MQVDYDDYIAGLERELAQGAKRAARARYRLPLPPRADKLPGSARSVMPAAE